MIISPRIRRTIAVTMIVVGAILMFLTPESWPGELVLVLGIAMEVAGIALEHKK